ncbi:MAG: acyltransferase [Pseudomonadota bacterium]
MTRPFSLYLDLLRVVAAFIVLLSHFAYERFTDGTYLIIRELNLGSDAVVLFFVLSGLVIAYAAEEKDGGPGRFFFNRATRMYSVAFPALLFGFVLDRSGALLNPEAYAGWWYNPLTLGENLFYGLTFASEWGIVWGERLGSNGPYWSLSYEVAYYLIFGAAIFLDGVKRVLAITVLCALVGMNVLLLMPIWLMGVWLWNVIKAGEVSFSRAVAWALTIGPLAAYGLCLAIGLPVALLAGMSVLTGLEVDTYRAVTRYSDEFVWNTLVGMLATMHLLGVWGLAKSWELSGGVVQRVIRWLAGASFSLYLVHYPVLQFADAALPLGPSGPVRDLALLVVVVAACLLFARWFERPLPQFRAAVKSLYARLAPQAA